MSDHHDEPIRTPPPETDRHFLEFDPDAYQTPVRKLIIGVSKFITGPGDWVRANIVEPNRGPKYYWYHRRFPRVLPIDECYIDDDACMFEADLEYQRLKRVDRATLEMLRLRRDSCYFYYKSEKGLEYRMSDKCKDLADTYTREELNFFIKYGELPYRSHVVHAYTKQKHRMIVERRRAQKASEECSD